MTLKQGIYYILILHEPSGNRSVFAYETEADREHLTQVAIFGDTRLSATQKIELNRHLHRLRTMGITRFENALPIEWCQGEVHIVPSEGKCA
jgi:hypothetical protein